MVWVLLVLAGVSWLVVALITEQQRGESISLSSRISAMVASLRKELPGIGARVRKEAGEIIRRAGRLASVAVEAGVSAASRRIHRPRRVAARSTPNFARSVAGSVRAPRVRGDGWRTRMVALLELILFVLFLSALFAGAVAAAAMRIGHLGA
jgi:hypothetical protein